VNEYQAMTTSELRRFIAVTQVAAGHAKETGDQALAITANRDIAAATQELSARV
jgi:hypothetical protein